MVVGCCCEDGQALVFQGSMLRVRRRSTLGYAPDRTYASERRSKNEELNSGVEWGRSEREGVGVRDEASNEG